MGESRGNGHIVDKEKFTASIFRRGNKQELLNKSQDVHFKDLNELEKVESLYELWKSPHSGKDLSAAIWRPQKQAAEVVLKRGKLFSYVGTVCGPKQYLCIEEAVYLVDRGSMMLFMEEGRMKKRLLSLKEAYTLMVDICGVPMRHYMVYCKFLRAGYVAHRHGLPWSIKGRGKSGECDFSWDGSAAVHHGKKSEEPMMKKRKVVSGCDIDSFQKGVNGGRTSEPITSTLWWPKYEFETSHDTRPMFQVIVEESVVEMKRRRFPYMVPLQTHKYTFDTLPSVAKQQRIMFLDVYPPNSNFSRKNCDARAGIVSMIGSARQDPPSETEVVTCVEKSEGTLVRFAGVEHGDIGLYSFLKTQLRDIH